MLVAIIVTQLLSHPAGVRGLKLAEARRLSRVPRSHPAGVRGLKPVKLLPKAPPHSVAPRRGAWIETPKPHRREQTHPVAPRRGAWIETRDNRAITLPSGQSHPAGVRGLKLYRTSPTKTIPTSHPAGVRGLKPEWKVKLILPEFCRTPQGCVD